MAEAVKGVRVRGRQRLVGAVAVLVMAGGMSLLGFAPGGAQTLSFTLVVNKVVTGAVPAGTTFTVGVSCEEITAGNTGAAGSTTSTTDDLTPKNEGVTPQTAPPSPVTMTFNSQGDPTSANSILLNIGEQCTVTETATGGAASVSYGCASTTVDLACESNQEVRQIPDDETGGTATVTVTNTFPAAAAAVVAEPQFTG